MKEAKILDNWLLSGGGDMGIANKLVEVGKTYSVYFHAQHEGMGVFYTNFKVKEIFVGGDWVMGDAGPGYNNLQLNLTQATSIIEVEAVKQ